MKDQRDLERIMEGIRRDVNSIPGYMLGSSSVPQEFASDERRRNNSRSDDTQKKS